MDAVAAGAVRAPEETTPLTERVLARLGRPRWLWMLCWAAVPLVSPLLFSTAARIAGREITGPAFLDLATTQVVLAYVCLVLLWGAGVLGRRAAELEAHLTALVVDDAPERPFRAVGSRTGPLALTAIVALVVSTGGWLVYGPLPPLVALLPLCIYLLPILTFTWVYVTILVDIDRLGRRRLRLDGFPEDRTLGLGEIGALASTGLGLLLIAAVPVLLAGSDEPVTFGVGLAVVGLAVGVFVLSMWRLHRQMAAAKAGFVEIARRFYAEAYAPVRADARLETLIAQSDALGAARALDERAHALPSWPIDEGAVKAIAVVVTGVVTSLIVRAVLVAIGF